MKPKPTREEIREALRERWPSLPIAEGPVKERKAKKAAKP